MFGKLRRGRYQCIDNNPYIKKLLFVLVCLVCFFIICSRFIRLQSSIGEADGLSIQLITDYLSGPSDAEVCYLEKDDEICQSILKVLGEGIYLKKWKQNDYFYSHSFSNQTVSVTYIKIIFAEGNEKKSYITLYSDGIAIIDGIFVRCCGVNLSNEDLFWLVRSILDSGGIFQQSLLSV